MAKDYQVNTEDERLTEIEEAGAAAESQLEKDYNSRLAESDKMYNGLIDGVEDWQAEQEQIQNDQTEFAIEQIEQQQEQAKKDYTREQSGAYVDWQKQSNQYGANAEAMAMQGMNNTGFSESSQVSMYNTYQNRVATARASYDIAVQNYNNAINQARLNNSAVLAEIATQAMERQMELALSQLTARNTLLDDLAQRKLQTQTLYQNQWQAMLSQLHNENVLKENARQHDDDMAYKREQLNQSKYQFQIEQGLKQQELDLAKQKFAWEQSQTQKTGAGTIRKDSVSDGRKIQNNSGEETKTKNSALNYISQGKVKSQSEAINLLTNYGIDASKLNPPLLTSQTWHKGKQIGESTSEFEGVNSYKEYLQYYCTWAVSTYL